VLSPPRPVEDPSEAAAVANQQLFLDDAVARGLQLAGEPVRQPDMDRDGRFGWLLLVEDQADPCRC
jgi:hypothetical protein